MGQGEEGRKGNKQGDVPLRALNPIIGTCKYISIKWALGINGKIISFHFHLESYI